jgi:hypothetical protein
MTLKQLHDLIGKALTEYGFPPDAVVIAEGCDCCDEVALLSTGRNNDALLRVKNGGYAIRDNDVRETLKP